MARQSAESDERWHVIAGKSNARRPACQVIVYYLGRRSPIGGSERTKTTCGIIRPARRVTQRHNERPLRCGPTAGSDGSTAATVATPGRPRGENDRRLICQHAHTADSDRSAVQQPPPLVPPKGRGPSSPPPALHPPRQSRCQLTYRSTTLVDTALAHHVAISCV